MATLTQPRVSGFKTNPEYKILFEPSPRRVRIKFNGEIIADSTNAHLLFETRHLPVYYFPRADVRMERMTPTELVAFMNEYLSEVVKGPDSKLHEKVLSETDRVKDECKAQAIGPCAPKK